MKKDNKKALYESIMTSVAKEVKKALNEYETVMKNGNRINNSDLFHRIEDLKKYGEVWISIADPKNANSTEFFERMKNSFLQQCKKEGLNVLGGVEEESAAGIIYKCFYLKK